MEQFSFPCLCFHLAFFLMPITHPFLQKCREYKFVILLQKFFPPKHTLPPALSHHTQAHKHTWVAFLHSPMNFKTLILLFGISLPDPLAF